ncbi:12276_t:CDS:2, partial [Acaulospora morrowiae]
QMLPFVKSIDSSFDVYFEPLQGTLTRLSILSYSVLCKCEFRNVYSFKAMLSTRKFDLSDQVYSRTMRRIIRIENQPPTRNPDEGAMLIPLNTNGPSEDLLFAAQMNQNQNK